MAASLDSSSPGGFRFPSKLPAMAFERHKQSVRSLRKTPSLALRAAPFAPGRPKESGHERKTKYALQESHHAYWFSRPNAKTRSTPNGTLYTRLSLATNVIWKQNDRDVYKTRTEWHRVISWNKLAEWAGALQKGPYVEVEGELRYREFTPAESERSVRVAEIYAHSILALDRSDKQPAFDASDSESGDEPAD